MSRRLAGVAAAAALLALGAGALPAGAQAAPRETTDATLTWGISGYAQVGIFGPWVLGGAIGGAEVLRGSVSGGTQDVYAVDPVPVTSMPRSSPQRTPNAVRFSGGDGAVDPSGAGRLAWTGAYTVNAYPASFGAPDETYADPVLTLAADGSGSLSFDVTVGAGVDLAGDPSPARQLGRVTVLTFSAGSRTALDDDGYRLSPDYQGVAVTPAGTAQVRCSAAGGSTGWWGSWAPELVTALPAGLQPHFYSTGCQGTQDLKPPLPVDLDLGGAGPGPSPTVEPSGSPTPSPTPSPSEPGALTWSSAAGTTSLGTAAADPTGAFVATGTLPAVTVTDTRPASPGFTLSAHARPFTSADGAHVFGAQALGWTPEVLEGAAGVRAGVPVLPSTVTGGGLASPRTLVSGGPTSGSVRVTAELRLRVPPGAAPGRYESVLTLTALG